MENTMKYKVRFNVGDDNCTVLVDADTEDEAVERAQPFADENQDGFIQLIELAPVTDKLTI
jgi:hypothetical protein